MKHKVHVDGESELAFWELFLAKVDFFLAILFILCFIGSVIWLFLGL